MSYSHAADGKLAPALQRGIQRLGKAWYRRPVVRVFRDETSLSVDPGLWSGIQRALEQCEYFLLMASVQSAASPWVRKEVEWWVAHRSGERLLIVVTDGEIAWDSAAGDFDWKKTTCVAPVLRGRFREEPHYVDLRWARDRSGLSLRNARFRAAVLTLAAPLHGRPMDELDGEDIRQQRLLRITAGIAVVVMGALTVASVVESRSAQEETRMAESRSMAAKSVELLGQKGGVDKAILLAVLAWRLSPTDEARSALEKLGSASMDVASITGQHAAEQIDSLAFSPVVGPPVLATGSVDGSTMLWRVPEGTVAGPPIGSDQTRIYELTFSANGSRLLTRGDVAPTEDEPNHETIVLHDLKAGGWKRVPTDALFQRHQRSSDLEGTSLSPDGRLVAFFSEKEIAVWDAATGGFRYKTVPGRLVGVHFVRDSRLMIVMKASDSYSDKVGYLEGFWDLDTDTVRVGPVVRREGIDLGSTVSFSKDGSKMVVWGFNGGETFLFGSRDGLSLEPMKFPGKVVVKDDIRYSVAFDADGGRVAIGGDKVAVWDLREGRVLKVVGPTSGSSDGLGALSADGRWLATTDHGKVVVWDLNAKESQGPATLEVACSLSGNNQQECIRRLCEKVSPLINDKDLSDALGSFDYERLKQTALSEPCVHR